MSNAEFWKMSEKFCYVEFQFSDLLGHLRAMVVPCNPVESLEELAKDPVFKEGTSVDGSSVTGISSVESSDLRLEADLSTLKELTYTPQRMAAVMCFIRRKGADPKKTYHALDSRSVLQSVCERYLKGGMKLMVKMEPEFHAVTDDCEPYDLGGYADTYPNNPVADTLLELATIAQEMGMRVRVAHHEHGNGQLEIELDYDDARKMADGFLLFKNAARALMQEEGFDVTFMPKPFPGQAGNGLHCHLQLRDAEKNLFGVDGTDQLSETARMFVAGLLEHSAGITAIANPTVNSYKRLVPHHEAPVYVCWGPMNRTVLLRVPLFTESKKAAIEIRSPDSMCNPYLLFAAIIVAGMDGVARKLKPPEPRTEDVFAMTDEQRNTLGIRTLPSTLREAVEALEKDTVLREALGRELVDKFVAIKKKECAEYTNFAVTDWEWEMYSSS